MPYKHVKGARVQRWPEDEDEPDISVENAKVEELYWESYSGDLQLTIVGDDGELWAIEVPIKPTGEWNNFVESLPLWDD